MISASNQFIRPLKMRYHDALKFAVVLFSDSVLKEPAQESIQLNNGDDDYVVISDLESKYRANKNNHCSCFRPNMIIFEHIIPGPKRILNGSAITDVYGGVILKYDFKNNKLNSPITSFEVTVLESSFIPCGKVISFFSTHIKSFASNVNERLVEKHSGTTKTPPLAEL
jgi:hypothetical protein